MQLDVAGRSENFLVDTGATYSVLIYSGAFSSQTCTILVLQEKLLKDSPEHSFVAGMDNIFPPVSGGP